MYELCVCRDFIAQHFLVGGDWGRENDRHSHHYKLEVRIAGEELDEHGYLMDIIELENAIYQVIELFSDKTLNDSAYFKDKNPSVERFSQVFWRELGRRLQLNGLRLSIRLWENENDWAAYSE